MAKLTGNWYTDPIGEFYSWQDYERLYAEQEQSNASQNQIPKITEEDCKITEEDCKKCPHLEILDVDDDYIYRCSIAKEFRTSSIRNVVSYINSNNIKCR